MAFSEKHLHHVRRFTASVFPALLCNRGESSALWQKKLYSRSVSWVCSLIHNDSYVSVVFSESKTYNLIIVAEVLTQMTLMSLLFYWIFRKDELPFESITHCFNFQYWQYWENFYGRKMEIKSEMHPNEFGIRSNWDINTQPHNRPKFCCLLKVCKQ